MQPVSIIALLLTGAFLSACSGKAPESMAESGIPRPAHQLATTEAYDLADI